MSLGLGPIIMMQLAREIEVVLGFGFVDERAQAHKKNISLFM